MALKFRFLGIVTRVHVWFLLTGWLLWSMWTGEESRTDGWATLLITWAVIFQGVYMHELGHALVGRRFGLEPQIELVALGGQTRWKQGMPLTPGKRLLVSFAGPAVGLVVGLPAFIWLMLAPELGPTLEYAVTIFAFINFGWALFNLLPMLPLDGGNIMASVFLMVSPKKGQRAARYVSFGVIGVMALLFLLFESGLMVAFSAMFAWMNYQGMVAEKKYADARVKLARRIMVEQAAAKEAAEGLSAELQAAYDALAEGDHERLAQIASALIVKAADDDARDEAYHFLAWARFLGGQPAQARVALATMSGARDADPALEGAVLLDLEEPEAAIQCFARALEEGHGGSFVETRWLQALQASGAWQEAARWLEAEAAQHVEDDLAHRVQEAAFAAGAFEAALAIGLLLFARSSQPIAAFNVACCLARLERPEEGLEWVGRALDTGLQDPTLLDRDEDLAPVRELPGWPAVRARVG